MALERPTCGTCHWWIEGRSGQGECGFAPPTAGVIGTLDHIGGGAVDGTMQAATLRPVVRRGAPCCARHPKAKAWVESCE